MLTASIKLTNLHYLEALEDLALHNLEELTVKPKLTILPFYNFVCKLVDILTQYSKLTFVDQESEYQTHNLNSFLVDFYFRKYQDNQNEIYRHLFSFLRSWKKYTEHHEQAKLFLSLLTPERNSKLTIKQFLKYRKCILKTLNQKILQQITINHQDALTIAHTLFSINSEIKSYATKKINEMFISLKRKLINCAKINGAVMCEFFMACTQKFQQQDINNIFQNQNQLHMDKKKNETQNIKQIQKSFQQKRAPLKYHNFTYLNPENIQKNQDIKYNLSFSEEFASYYSPPMQSDQLEKNSMNKNIEEESQKYNTGFNQESSDHWKIHKSQQQESPMIKIRNSLTFLKQKDRKIDEKLRKYPKIKDESFYQDEQSKENVRYPKGWDNFIRTNEETKRKLMNRRHAEDEDQDQEIQC